MAQGPCDALKVRAKAGLKVGDKPVRQVKGFGRIGLAPRLVRLKGRRRVAFAGKQRLFPRGAHQTQNQTPSRQPPAKCGGRIALTERIEDKIADSRAVARPGIARGPPPVGQRLFGGLTHQDPVQN